MKNLSALIDEEKLYTPYHIDKGRTVYADHGAFIITMNREMEKTVEKDKRKSMKFGKSEIEKYKKITNGKNFTNIATNCTADTNKKYKQWENEIKKSAKSCFKKVSINKYSRQDPVIARMMKRKRKLKKAGGDDPISQLRDRLINEQIEKLLCEQQKRKVDKTVEKIINTGGVNSPEFWEILKVKSKRQEIRCAMKDKNGNLKETEEEIQNIYRDNYNELLKTPSAENEEEENAEKEVEENFDLLKRTAKNKIETEEITMEELNTAIKQMKKKKAADIGGMKAEYVIYAANEARKSLLSILNEIYKKNEIPKKWEKMKIKSLYKNKGSRSEMTNQRGLFITNIVSKIFERIILNRNRDMVEEMMSPFQCGGKRGRGTVDHLFVFRAIIDDYRSKNKDLYVFYGDLEKCFDRLWLKDCLLERWRTGMTAKEVMLIYEMNKNCLITIETPFGKTEEIVVEEVVRQGTIWGPFLCSIVTEKINRVGERVSILLREFMKNVTLAKHLTRSRLSRPRTLKISSFFFARSKQ